MPQRRDRLAVDGARLRDLDRIGIKFLPPDGILSTSIESINRFITQIDSASVTVNAFSTLNLNGNSDKIGALTLAGGTVFTGAGTLTLGGNITSNVGACPASIRGNLDLGCAAVYRQCRA